MNVRRNRMNGSECRPVRRRLPRGVVAFVLAGLLVVAESHPATAQSSSDTQSHPPGAENRDRSAFRSAVIATVAGNLMDSFTTVASVRGGHTREINPVLGQNPARILVLKGLFTVSQVLAEKHLVDHGHPRAARWFGYAAGGFAAALAIHNVRTMSP